MNETEKIEREQMFEQYKILIDTALRTTSTKSTVQRFYISILSLLFGGIGIFYRFMGEESPFFFVFLLGISFFAVLLCVLWFRILSKYMEINTKKFYIIHEMEKWLPFKCFQKEFALRHGNNENGIRDDCLDFCVSKYDDKSIISAIGYERLLPLFCALSFVFLMIFSIVKLYNLHQLSFYIC